VHYDGFHVSDTPTPWSGELVGDSVWQDSVTIDDDLTVPTGVTLTVENGTAVTRQNSAALDVDGTLQFEGIHTTTGNISVDGTVQIDSGLTWQAATRW
jgi:hypothetical protein